MKHQRTKSWKLENEKTSHSIEDTISKMCLINHATAQALTTNCPTTETKHKHCTVPAQ